uniref:Uncharacterized protein n=1 Tax=Cannabis sativa TaxID=3483 RepID=A0A803QCJ5_CANSA
MVATQKAMVMLPTQDGKNDNANDDQYHDRQVIDDPTNKDEQDGNGHDPKDDQNENYNKEYEEEYYEQDPVVGGLFHGSCHSNGF